MEKSEHKNQQLFTMEYFKILSDYLPGKTTLNQIRVIQFIGLGCLDDGPGTTHSEICESLELNPTTVTRATGRFIQAGLIRHEIAPEDGRQRFLMMGSKYRGHGNLDENVKELAQKYFREDRHFAAPSS